MTKLLKQGIEAVKDLPADRQDLAGEILLVITRQASATFRLTAEQIDDVRLAMAEADRGEFAAPDEVETAWKTLGA